MGAFVCSSFRPGQLPFNGRPGLLRPAAVHKSFASSTTILKADLEQLRDVNLLWFMIVRDFFAFAKFLAEQNGRVGQQRSLKCLLLYVFEISHLNQQEHAIP
jgi:hypothetical protein